jgi:hypothetical protein
MCNRSLIKRYFVAGVVVSAAALPGVAQATVIEVAGGEGGGGGQSVARAAAPARHLAPSAQSGFDWADAGIGAGGAILLVGAGAAGVVGIGHSRRRTDRRVLLG